MKLFKKSLTLSIVCCMLFSFSTICFAQTTSEVKTEIMSINGSDTEINTVTISDRKFIELRKASELLGYKVSYLDGVIIMDYEKKISNDPKYGDLISNTLTFYTESYKPDNSFLWGGSYQYKRFIYSPNDVNNRQSFTGSKDISGIEYLPIIDGKSYVPLRIVAEEVEYKVDYINGKVNINK